MHVLNGYIRIKMNKKIFIYHSLAWVAFMIYEMSTIYFVIGKLGPFSDYAPHYFLNIILFYTNALIITREKRLPKILLLISLQTVLYIFVNYWLNTFLEAYVVKVTRPVNPLFHFIISSFYRCIYFTGLSTLYGFAVNLLNSREKINALLTDQLNKERREAAIENDLLVTKNALLRAQINPHLFFNSLNFIYNSVHKLSAVAGEAVMLLADITRYSISKADEDGLVYLEDELNSIADLLSLNQIRLKDGLYIRYERDLDAGDLKVLPLAMLTLVENLIKYGDLRDQEQPAIIKVQLTDGYLHFATRNKKLNDQQQFKGTGMGLTNTKLRLKQAYQDKYHLRINETSDTFFVDLTIQADCLCLAAI